MKLLLVMTLVVGSTALLVPRDARGQTPGWTGYVTLGGGYQGTSNDFGEALTFEQFVEQASFNSAYEAKAGPAFDFGGGVRLWNDLAFGISVSLYRDDGPIPFRARFPHPFFYNRHREVSGEVAGKRRELGTHFDAVYMIRPADRVRLAVFGGPSMFVVDQTLVTDLTVTDEYPYDAVTLQGPVLSTESVTRTGFNLGADVMYLLTGRLGMGGLIRFSRATVNFAPGEDRVISVEVGGLQTSVGLRVLF